MSDNSAIDVFAADSPRLFLLDVRHNVDRLILRDWLAAEHGVDFSDPANRLVALGIGDDRKDIDVSLLVDALAAEPETRVIPLRVVWQFPAYRNDRRLKMRHFLFGDPRQPGPLRAWLVRKRDPGRAQCVVGKPATIAELQDLFASQGLGLAAASRATDFAQFVVRQASIVLESVERGMRGSRYKVPRFVTQAISSSPGFRTGLAELAEQLGKPLDSLEKEARGYMKEMVSRPTPFFIDMRGWFDRFALSLGYDKTIAFDPAEIPRLRTMMRDHPTILLFTHKTYIDGGTPTDICYRNDLPLLHIFGGINMNLFGFGYMIKRAGAIFIRRSFQDNPVYKLVLRHYVAFLMEKRFPLTWAFEGTRSRLGKLMPPRYGLLKYVLDAAHAAGIENVHLVPVVTSFDLIKDVEEYALEQAGRMKKPETIGWFVGYIRSLRKPMGRIYVDFGREVVVQNAPAPDDKLALPKIAFEFAVEANRVVPLTLTPLLCLILLGTAPRAVTASELEESISKILVWAAARKIRISDDLRSAESAVVESTVATLVESGLLVRFDQGSDTLYAIEPAQHAIASYYRNSIVHHFLDKAIIELALLKACEAGKGESEAVFWCETERLRELFKFEFFFPPRDEFRAALEIELDRSAGDWREAVASGGEALRGVCARLQPFINHAVLLPFAEAYAIAIEVLARAGHGHDLTVKACVESALVQARQALMLRQITSAASIGKLLFQNGYSLAANLGLAGPADDALRHARLALLKELRDICRRMEFSRLEVQAFADKRLEEKVWFDAAA